MKKYIFALRDKKIGAYQNPFYRRDDIEHVTEEYVRGCSICPLEERARARDMALYYLGTFDDVEGKFDLLDKDEKLLDFEDYIKVGDSDVKGS